VSTGHEIVERLLDALYTSGHEQVWEILSGELAQVVADIAIERRYWAGLQWLDEVDKRLQSSGVQLPPLMFLQVLINAAGDELDRTMLLPTGIQNIRYN
jgi:hypothetical protein